MLRDRLPGGRAAVSALLALAAAAAITMAAFVAFPAADADRATLRGFQIRVLNISQAASEDRLPGALAALQALEADVQAAFIEGRLSASRHHGIDAALDAVRADVNGLLAQAGSAAEAASVAAPDSTAQGSAAGTATAAAPGMTTTAPPEEVAAPVVVVPEEPVPAPGPAGAQEAARPDIPGDKGQGKGRGGHG